jgi:hypothetical protein
MGWSRIRTRAAAASIRGCTVAVVAASVRNGSGATGDSRHLPSEQEMLRGDLGRQAQAALEEGSQDGRVMVHDGCKERRVEVG